MAWEIPIESILKSALGGAAFFVGKYCKKKWPKFYEKLKKLWGIPDRFDIIDLEVGVLKSKQMAAIHTAAEPIYIMNPEGELIYANPAWAEMTNFHNVSDAYGKGYLQAIPEEDIEKVERQAERLVEHPSSFDGVIRFKPLRKDLIIVTHCRSELVRDRTGKIVETIGRLKIIK